MQPAPYSMCSRKECESREVSVLEATPETCFASAKMRIMDPCRAVSQYRRAASTVQYPSRTPQDRRLTVEYLGSILCTQQTAYQPSSSVKTRQKHALISRVSLKEAVDFVQDRLRALQVECIQEQDFDKKMQFRVICMQILILYLVSDNPSYTRVFGEDALKLSFDHYWMSSDIANGRNDNCDATANNGDNTNESEQAMDDKILSWQLLFMTSQVCVKHFQADSSTLAESRGVPVGSLSSLMYRHVRRYLQQGRMSSNLQNNSNSIRSLPCVSWALGIVNAVSRSEWRTVLSLLRPPSLDALDTIAVHNQPGFNMYCVLVRCCLAPCLPWIFMDYLHMYNQALMKQEALTCQEVARILILQKIRVVDTFNNKVVKDTWDDYDDDDDDTANESKVNDTVTQSESQAVTSPGNSQEGTRGQAGTDYDWDTETVMTLCTSMQFAIQSGDSAIGDADTSGMHSKIVFKSQPIQWLAVKDVPQRRWDLFMFDNTWTTGTNELRSLSNRTTNIGACSVQSEHTDKATQPSVDKDGFVVPPPSFLQSIISFRA
jgi:hypothetical protein